MKVKREKRIDIGEIAIYNSIQENLVVSEFEYCRGLIYQAR